jgi:transcriptional regulator with XRE-family HTH domain
MPEKLEQLFGRIIRRRRETAGLTQEDLGHDAGISRNYVGMLERGERTPTIHVLRQLAFALKVTMTALIQELEASLGAPGKPARTRRKET